jgi:transcriptional regulator with XRE-family HTH domain
MKSFRTYLKTFRRRGALTEPELASLLGWRSGSVVSRLERYKRHPSLKAAFAFQVIFGVGTAELFPALYAEVEEAVMRRAYELHEQLQGNSSKATKAKLDLLEAALKRAGRRAKHAA